MTSEDPAIDQHAHRKQKDAMTALVAPLTAGQRPDLQPLIRMITAVNGYVPNSVLTMARVQGLPEAFVGLTRVILGPGTIDSELKSLVALMTSAVAGCRYCQAHTAHSAIGQGATENKTAAIWEFETSPLFDDSERAALRLARAAGQNPNAVNEQHRIELRTHFNDEQITELVAVTALFGFLNRWNDTMSTPLEPQPASTAKHVLTAGGWSAGKHQGADEP